MAFVDDFAKRFDSARERKGRVEWALRTCAYFSMANRARLFETYLSDIRFQTSHLFDLTAMRALRDFAGVSVRLLLPRAAKWAKMTIGAALSSRLDAADDQAQSFRHKLMDDLGRHTNSMMSAIDQSYFYGAARVAFLDLGGVGTCATWIGDDGAGGLQVRDIDLGSLFLESDGAAGIAAAFYRHRLTPEAADQKFAAWGLRLSERFDGERKRSPLTFVEGLRYLANGGSEYVIAVEMPAGEPRKTMRENGYEILTTATLEDAPLVVGRWTRNQDSPWGTGIIESEFPELMSLNYLRQLHLQSTALRAMPTFLAGQGVDLGKLAIRPGGAIQVNSMGRVTDSFAPLPMNDSPENTFANIMEMRGEIRKELHVSEYNPETQQAGKTATEWLIYDREQRAKQSESYEIVMDEWLRGCIRQVAAVLRKQGKIDPEIIVDGQVVDIEFNNAISQARQTEDVNAARALLEAIGAVAQIDPSAALILDADSYIREWGKSVGANPDLLQSPEEMEKLREQMAQAQQQAAQQEGAAAQPESGIIPPQ